MARFVGCDVGTVSVKAALVTDEPLSDPSPHLRELPHRSPALVGWRVYVSPYRRLRGEPVRTVREVLADAGFGEEGSVCFTGKGGRFVSRRLGAAWEGEQRALARGVALVHPDVSRVIAIGGESSRLLAVRVDPATGEVGVEDYAANGDCAAGTGSFLDQQAARLRYRVEEVGDVCATARWAAKIAARCSVFAKTDMIHAQQKGAEPPEVLRGLCEAVAHAFRAGVARGRPVTGRVAFVGGVAENRAVRLALAEAFGLDGQLFVPAFPAFYEAVGAAAAGLARDGRPRRRSRPSTPTAPAPEAAWPRLSLERVVLLRDAARARVRTLPPDARGVPAYLGLDVGSVSTNVVCIDANGELLHEVYLRTEGRPMAAVARGLAETEALLGERVAVFGVGATGSGRDLAGELVGADAVHDEITAHTAGAFHVARRHLGTGVDTIFEIGGQDSKYIHLRDGVVVEFAMNEACAAGTGSFLEEQAEDKLGVGVVDGEFARLALAAERPVRLGERCTVFMERDVARWEEAGADRGDLVAGLAYAVVQNYLNRVVRGRPVGEVVFFQGGTAYNDAVAAAFAEVLGRPVVVPPHNGVIGAYGAALLARDKAAALGRPSAFRGWRVREHGAETRFFTCRACPNRCDVQEVTVDGRRTYWGDRCAEKYRREPKERREPAVPDLWALRARLLEADHLAALRDGRRGDAAARRAEAAARWAAARDGAAVGLPRALYHFEHYPLWGTYLAALGFRVVVSEPTAKDVADRGVEAAVAEPCFPVQVAHGHAARLIERGVDLLFVPNVVDAPAEGRPRPGDPPSYLCPWGQTLPFVLAASPAVGDGGVPVARPTVHLGDGPGGVERELWPWARGFGFSRRHHRAAVALGWAAWTAFRGDFRAAGRDALAALRRAGEPGVVVVGRSYNLYDPGVNLNLPHKLRALYGVNLLPLDALPLREVEVADVNRNLYWTSGQRILRAARFAAGDPGLHLLYLTNFKCGPDSYLRQFAEDAAVAPFLALQFDGHGNDAGLLTRCEAYLDSKGILRWWRNRAPSPAEPSTCPGCASGAPAPRPPPSGP